MPNNSLLIQCAALCLAAFSPIYAVSMNSIGPVDILASMPSNVFSPVLVSGDGSTVAATGGGHGFTWTPAGGRVPLAGFYSNFSTGLSYDGSTVVGGSFENEGWRPVYCRSGTKTRIYVSLETDSYANAVSADGQTVVGACYDGVFKWKNGSVWYAGYGRTFSARGMSADATTVVGAISNDKVQSAVMWKDGTIIWLGNAGSGAFSSAYGVSPDGKVVFGHTSGTTTYSQPFRWTAADGIIGLGTVPGQQYPSDMGWMKASNYDGSILVGSAGLKGGDRATIWDAQHGIRFLDEVLTGEYGVDLAGWQLREATGMSWDGQTIAGYGINPQGVREGWVVNIPEPASLLLLALGFTLGLTRSTRHSLAGD